MLVRLVLVLAAGVLLTAQSFNTNLITTIAGTGQLAPINSVALSTPLPPGAWGKPAVDAAGNVYFSITALNTVFRVTPSGRIERFAGNGFARFSGDGGQAELASLSAPRDVAIDSRGVIYIADSGNKRIRRVQTSRVIDTLAGGGSITPSPTGTPLADATLPAVSALAIDGSDNLYANIDGTSIGRIDYYASQIRLYAGTPGRGGTPVAGPVANVQFRIVSSLSADKAGNLYLADAGAISIVRITAAGQVDVLTTRSATYGIPVDLAVDSTGYIYYSQNASPVIWRLQISNGSVDIYSGDISREGYTPSGTARERALFGNDLRLGVDARNNIIVGDNRNGRLRRVSGSVDSIAGTDLLFKGETGPAIGATFISPSYIAQSRSGTYYFTDSASRLVFAIEKGIVRRFAGNGALNATYTDGRAALETSFGAPYGVAVDTSGTVYVADDDCAIRRIGADGAVHLHAGIPNLCGTSLDGATLKDARFGRLRGLTMDASGNLFAADVTNHKVWRLGADGSVRNFAGTGAPGTTTTSLPAVQAALNTPLAVAVAPDNTVFISDSLNNRVVRVGSDARLATYAGVGQRASTGDNGPASAAALNQPAGLTIDKDGNLYISEISGHRVRRISPTATITTYAGTGTPGFRGDGGFAISALLNGPHGLLVNNDGALVIADRDNGRLRLALNTPPTVNFSVAPISVSLTPGNYAQRGTIDLPTTLAGLSFETSVRYTGPVTGWLSVTPPRGALPATISFETNTAGLAAGDYTGQIIITVSSGLPRETAIPITLKVPPVPTAPPLTVGTSRLTLSALRGATASQTVPVVNGGATPLLVRGAVTKGAFLTVEPAQLTVAPGETALFTVTAAANNIAVGTYSGTATFTAGQVTSNVSVSFTVTAARSRLQISQTGLFFRAVAGGATPSPQVVYGSLPQLGAHFTTTSGVPWLRTAPNGNQVTVSVIPRELPVGDHYGRIEIFDATTPALRQFATVLLQVLPAGSDPGPDVSTAAIFYTAPAGGEVAGQEVYFTIPTNRRAAFTMTGATFEGLAWLRYSPSAGSITGDAPVRIAVQPDLTGLNPGVYRATMTLNLDDGKTCTVSVLSVVTPKPVTNAKAPNREASSCSSPNLFPQVLSPAAGFRATVGEPVRLAARVVDGCGNPHQPESGGSAGVAVTGFGTQVVNLSHVGGGVWEGTVTPNNIQNSITLTYLGLFSRGAFLQAGADKVGGAIVTAQRPVIFADSLTDAASFQFGAPVGPGTLVSLFGDNLSADRLQPTALPLPALLGDVEVRLNDQPIPLLYAGPGQVNAQIPYNLPADAEYQLEIRRGSAITTPQSVVLAQARPGIFTVDQSGAGQGHIYRALTDGSQQLADGANSAATGEILVIYCNGLGATNPGVTAGDASPASPLAYTLGTATLTIGGQPAAISYAGLAPGFAGLYQVNAVVPSGITPGANVPVVLTVASQSSVPVTMGIR